MKLRKLLLIVLALGIFAVLFACPAGADANEPYSYRETATSSDYTNDQYTVRTPSDEPGILYVEGKTEIETTAFMITLNGQDKAYIRAFVYPDSNGEFAVRINTAAGNKEYPEASRGSVVTDELGGQSNSKCYSTTPGFYAVKEIPTGFYRINISRATTALQAQGIFDTDSDYAWNQRINPLSGYQGFACKEIVLYVENNVPHILHYPEVSANNDAVRAADTPLTPGTAAYVQYTDPYLTDLEWSMNTDDRNIPIFDEQAAFLADAAAEITAGATDDYQKVLQIYRYVCENLYYDLYAYNNGLHSYCNPYDCLYKLRSGISGPNCINGKVATTCNGFASLVVALARAEGIPARMVKGVQLSNSKDAWNNTEKYSNYQTKTTHWWSEVYVDGRWIVIDAQRGSGNSWSRSSWDVADDDCWQKADSITYAGFDMSEDCLSGTYYYHDVCCSPQYKRDIPAPVILSADTAIGYVSISWEPVDGAEYYIIYRGTDPGELNYLDYVKGEKTSFISLKELEEPDVTYYYRVMAKIGSVYGTRSRIISACVTQEERDGALRAPEFDQQPNDVEAEIGDKATFTVRAHNGQLSYQWLYFSEDNQAWYKISSSAYEGIETATLTVPVTEARNGMRFRCRVSNELFQTDSEPAVLTALSKPPVIQTHPSPASGALGSSVRFSVKASGNGLTYKWQYYSEANQTWYSATSSVYSGGDTSTLTVSVKSWLDGVSYRCQVSNPSGKVYSDPASLTVKPTISTQPKSVSVYKGDTASFTVKATGSNLTYQWQYRKSESGSWINSTLDSSNSVNLSVKATAARDGYQYRCRVKNSAGTCYSQPATLTLKPNILSQPGDKSVYAGNTAVFSVRAGGSNLSCRWQYYSKTAKTWYSVSGDDYSGGDTASMSVKATPKRNGMKYRCRVSNNGVVSYSETATLTVKALITYQPWDTWAIPGETTGFTVHAGGSDTQFQWQYRTDENGTWKNTTLSGCKTASLSFQATLKRDGCQYRCRVSNNGVSEYSEPVTLNLKRLITSQPKSASGALGSKVTFSVTAAAGSGLSYQWQYSTDGGETWKNSTLTGCRTAKLTVQVTEARRDFQYRCKVSNNGVTVISNAAKLRISS